MKRKQALIYTIAGLILLVPYVVTAQFFGPIVPCDGPRCGACDLVVLAERIITFLISVAVFLAVLAFAWAGFLMLTARGDTGQIERGKRVFGAVAIGFLLVLGSWLLVDTILRVFTQEGGIQAWTALLCGPIIDPEPRDPDDTATTTGGGVSVGEPSDACVGGCTFISSSIPIKEENACLGGGACQASSVMVSELESLTGTLASEGVSWQVTEAWPPTVTHSNPCHLQGTCVDANFTGGTEPTADNVNTFISAAAGNGLRAVYEVSDREDYDALIADGVPTSNVLYLPPRNGRPQITAPHFSVYIN